MNAGLINSGYYDSADYLSTLPQNSATSSQTALAASGTAPNDIYSSALQNLMTTGKSQVGVDPSYQNRFEGGQQALERSQAAKGFWGSGNMATALADYGQKAASDEYQAQYSRLANIASMPYDLKAMDIQNQMLGRSNIEAQQAFNKNQYGLEKQATAGQLATNNTNRPIGFSFGGSLIDPVDSYYSTPSSAEQITRRRKELGLI